MALTEKHIQHKCLFGTGAAGRTCRYLEHDSRNWKVKHCLKLLPGRKRSIDKDTTKYIKEQKKHGRDPLAAQWGQACGDNCKGYTYLPTVIQGYDVKSKP